MVVIIKSLKVVTDRQTSTRPSRSSLAIFFSFRSSNHRRCIDVGNGKKVIVRKDLSLVWGFELDFWPSAWSHVVHLARWERLRETGRLLQTPYPTS